LATFGIVLGAFFVGQQGKAEDGVGSNPAPGKASSASAAAAGQQKRAATADESEATPLSDFGSRRPSGTFGGRQTTATALPPAPLTVLKSGPEHTRVVYRLKATPVTDIDSTIKQLLHLEGELHNSGGAAATTAARSRVAIASSVVNNSLVISGPPDAVEEVLRLVEKLDHSAGLILLEMEMGEAPVDAAKQGESTKGDGKPTTAATPSAFRLLDRPAKMETTARARLTTLDNQPAFVQMGARVPRATGVTTSPTNGRFSSTSMTYLNVGLIVGMTPRISPDGTIAMQINVEQSQLGPENEGTPVSVAGDKVVRSPRIDTTTVQTTVAVPDGKTIILGSVARQGRNEKEFVILVTPHILGLEEAKKTR
jgi:type II secretory pathway component GspD/PulD (secretin)